MNQNYLLFFLVFLMGHPQARLVCPTHQNNRPMVYANKIDLHLFHFFFAYRPKLKYRPNGPTQWVKPILSALVSRKLFYLIYLSMNAQSIPKTIFLKQQWGARSTEITRDFASTNVASFHPFSFQVAIAIKAYSSLQIIVSKPQNRSKDRLTSLSTFSLVEQGGRFNLIWVILFIAPLFFFLLSVCGLWSS